MKKKESNEEILKDQVDQEAMDVESTESDVEVDDDAVEVEATRIEEEDSQEETAEAEETEETETDDASDEADTDEASETAKVAELLVKAEEELKASEDRYARTMAEFDNFRKRTLREKTEMHERGAKEILEKLLPVVDNFERAIDHISDGEKDLGITQGVEMIYKQLMGTLSEMGVEEIEALDSEFDPNLHNAVQHEENEDYGENLVQDVYQKGYMYKDAVLRHSMVKVVN